MRKRDSCVSECHNRKEIEIHVEKVQEGKKYGPDLCFEEAANS
jgi:hypothetical protein